MENEKKELNSSELEQVNGGQKGSRIHNINKRIGEKISGNKTKEEKERNDDDPPETKLLKASESGVGIGGLVNKLTSWIGDFFSGDD